MENREQASLIMYEKFAQYVLGEGQLLDLSFVAFIPGFFMLSYICTLRYVGVVLASHVSRYCLNNLQNVCTYNFMYERELISENYTYPAVRFY